MGDKGGAGGSGGFGGLGFGDVLVVLEELFAEEGVDLHDAGDALNLDAAAFGGEAGVGFDASGLDALGKSACSKNGIPQHPGYACSTTTPFFFRTLSAATPVFFLLKFTKQVE